MRVRRLDISNFRGINSATIDFSGHTVLIGPNNSGKTTVLEALDLALGPDRTIGPDSVDEHDFFRDLYLPPPEAVVHSRAGGGSDSTTTASVGTEATPAGAPKRGRRSVLKLC